ncbi:hypothetical protein [Nonomuraea sp. NPDC048826]|uniref:hypothetical protein n=1 Tax=Nonomuraea sp. NPDC048826 TaxID=3364347 RepID=UPI0037139E9C
MSSPKIAAIVLVAALMTGCGDGGAATAGTTAEAVSRRMQGAAGVRVAVLVRPAHGGGRSPSASTTRAAPRESSARPRPT